MGNFGRGHFDVFDVIQLDHQNLSLQIFKAIQRVKDSNHPSNYLSKFPPSKFSAIRCFTSNTLYEFIITTIIIVIGTLWEANIFLVAPYCRALFYVVN